MLIKLKNKDTLELDCFKFKCCIGQNNIKKEKFEGDKATPKGIFSIGPVYYRPDRVDKPVISLKTIIIKSNMGWCNDPKSKFYNKEIKISKKIKYEKLFRKDFKYNKNKIIPNRGSAIFIHLTKNYKPTAGCMALKEKDFLILLKLVKKNTKIKIT